MALQIAKDIGSLATVVAGQLDAIILTGGLAFSRKLVALLRARVDFLAKVAVIPGRLLPLGCCGCCEKKRKRIVFSKRFSRNYIIKTEIQQKDQSGSLLDSKKQQQYNNP